MIVLAAGFAALIVGMDLYIVDAMTKRAEAEFDEALLAKARAIVVLTEQDDGQVEMDYNAKLMPEFEREHNPEYFQFWLDDGTVLHRSARMRPDQNLPLTGSPTEVPQIRDAPLGDGRDGRVLELAFVPGGDERGDEGEPKKRKNEPEPEPYDGKLVLAVGRGRERLDEALATMRLVIFGVGGLAILLAALLVWRALITGFRPIHSIATQVEGLDADSLSAKVELPRTPQELAPIVDQLNALLARLDASFERERRFAGNVAHELRTPIAELRSLAVVGAKWPDDQASVAAFFVDVNDIAGRMETVIADLMLLARCQAGVEPAVNSPTSVRQVVTAVWTTLEKDAARAGLRLNLDLPPDDITLNSDVGKLAIVLTNVFGNAISYAKANGEIRCVGSTDGDRFRLDVMNDAEPMSREDLAHITEPFWRKDEARASSEHAGLGLSLVSALADLLGMAVRFDQDPAGTFRVRLTGRIPCSGSAVQLRRIPT